MDNDPRDFTLMRAESLRPGDVVLSWYPDDVASGPRVVASVERRPAPSFGGEVSWRTDIYFTDGGSAFAVTGLRKVQRPAAA